MVCLSLSDFSDSLGKQKKALKKGKNPKPNNPKGPTIWCYASLSPAVVQFFSEHMVSCQRASVFFFLRAAGTGSMFYGRKCF